MAKSGAAKLLLLKLLVFGMGFAILAAAGVVAYGVATRVGKPRPEAPAREFAVDLPAGAEVLGSDLGDDRVALRLRLPDGSLQLWVVELDGGRVSHRITLAAPGD